MELHKGKLKLAISPCPNDTFMFHALANDCLDTGRYEFTHELVRFMPCVRFVRQLCADEWSETMFREPRKARWGVRASLWDPRMPGEASALALITVQETLAAAERMAK